jgi:uncharacterized membrane protein YoaT (DUF817 family)
MWHQLILGAHFDVLDLFYYGFGLIIGLILDSLALLGALVRIGTTNVQRIDSFLHRGRLTTASFAARHGRWAQRIHVFVVFGVKQAWACLFGFLILCLLVGSHYWYPESAWLSRYDFMVIACVTIQLIFLLTGLETLEEAKVILLYHLVGTIMELFKTSMGSWNYPEESVLCIGAVPLFSGFMYASVGSYIARAWRLFDLRFKAYPPLSHTFVLAALIYMNFFTHHYVYDLRWGLVALVFLLYGKSEVFYRVDRKTYSMPLVIGFSLITLFIWIAENVATYAKAWTYPHQTQTWQLVGFGKFGSWFLLMIVSFVLVSAVSKVERS